MNDVIITGRRLRCELWTAGFCLFLAILVNGYAIIAYKTPWSELVTAWRMTLAVAAVLYVLWGVVRLGIAGVKRIARR